MNIRDLSKIDMTISSKEEYLNLKWSVGRYLNQIRENYSDKKRHLIDFIYNLEQVYLENPDVDKIKFDYKAEMFNGEMFFGKSNGYVEVSFVSNVIDADKNEKIESPSVPRLNKCLSDIFHHEESDYDYSLDDYSDRRDVAAYICNSVEEAYFLDKISETPRGNRFRLYSEIANFADFRYEDDILDIIGKIKMNEPIVPKYKTLSFLGADLDISIINMKEGRVSLDATESTFKAMEKRLNLAEDLYVMYDVKSAILDSNLNFKNGLTLKVASKNKDEESRYQYYDYILEAKDIHGDTVRVDISFAEQRYLSNYDIKEVSIKDLDKAIGKACNMKWVSDYLSWNKWKGYEASRNKVIKDKSINIGDVDLSNCVIQTSAEYEMFKENISKAWPKIEQNYDKDKEIMVNFILKMEKVYAEHPNIPGIIMLGKPHTTLEDRMNNIYTYSLDLMLLSEHLRKEINGPAVKELFDYMKDVFIEKASRSSEPENGGRIALTMMDNDLCLSHFSTAGITGRFFVYRKIAQFSSSHNQSPLNNFIEAIQSKRPVEDSYKIINLLGRDVIIKTMGVKDNALDLDANPNIVSVLKDNIEGIECSYVINKIRETVLRSELNKDDVLKISFHAKEPKNYLNYICKVEDAESNQIDIDVDFALSKRQGLDRSLTEVSSVAEIDRDLSIRLAGSSKYKELENRVLRDKENIDFSSLDKKDSTWTTRPRMKM